MMSSHVHLCGQIPRISCYHDKNEFGEYDVINIEHDEHPITFFVDDAQAFAATLAVAVEKSKCAEQTRAIGEQFVEGMETVEGEA